jgi:hypothetical protein
MLKKSIIAKLLLLFVGFSFFILTTANASAAGLVPCGLGKSDPCTLCHFLIGIKGLIDWGMKIIVTLSIAGISIAGVMYVISSGDPTFATKAKGFVTSIIIGFSLMLGGWLIINTTFWLLSAQKDGDDYSLGLESKNWYTFNCSTTSTTSGTLPPTGETPIEGYDCSQLSFQSGISAQCNDASDALKTLIVCMRNKLGSKMTINSISDSAGLSNCQTKYAESSCAHTAGSCHYGGADNAGQSEAVDISTKTGLTVNNITTAANECSAGYVLDESAKKNHVHVSTSACKNN